MEKNWLFSEGKREFRQFLGGGGGARVGTSVLLFLRG